VSWSSSRKTIGAQKSISLARMLTPLACEDLHFVNLQYGDTSAERLALQTQQGIEVQHLDEVDNFHDLDGLAALIQACDVVITTSNTTAHLAGALGKETLLLLPQGKGRLWYWHEHQGHNPWYPSLRSFEQDRPGDWALPLAAVKNHLSR
jgi:ADP-heptose:LPS heptosyltransferase